MSDNVIFLNFTSPKVNEETIAIIACVSCRNKTFTLTSESAEQFPTLRCAACQQNLGRMGWWNDNDPGAA